MEKLLVDVKVPSTGEICEVRIPAELSIRKLTGLLAEAAVQLSHHRYVSSGEELLCLSDGGAGGGVLDPDAFLADYPVQNGDCLLLI